jgi:hypothetical protein
MQKKEREGSVKKIYGAVKEKKKTMELPYREILCKIDIREIQCKIVLH